MTLSLTVPVRLGMGRNGLTIDSPKLTPFYRMQSFMLLHGMVLADDGFVVHALTCVDLLERQVGIVNEFFALSRRETLLASGVMSTEG